MRTKCTTMLFLFLSMLMLSACSNLEDVYRRLDEVETRLAKIEKLTDGANRDIKAMKTLLETQGSNISIKSYRPLDDNSGYLLEMSNGDKIVLKNGTDGTNSSMGVKRGEDGVFYWTINGQYMYDSDGNKIKASGQDGANGVTPIMRVNKKNNYWEYSVDGGASWHLVLNSDNEPVEATGGSTSDLQITETDKSIIIVFKGQTFVISKESGNPTPNPVPSEIVLNPTTKEIMEGESFVIEARITPNSISTDRIVWTSSNEKVAIVENGNVRGVSRGNATITATIGSVKAVCEVVVNPKFSLTFDITINGIQAIDANFSIVPSDEESIYYFSSILKEEWDKIGGANGILEYERHFWNSAGSIEDALRQLTTKGSRLNQNLSYSGISLARPGTSYIVYAFGVNYDGTETSEIFYKEIKTLPEQSVSDLTFDVKIEEVLNNGVIAKVTPSNSNYTYMVVHERKSFIDGRAPNRTPQELKAVGYELASIHLRKKDFEFSQGEITITPTTHPMRKNRDYVIMVFGIDKDRGIFTDPKLVDVKTKN